MRRHSGKDRGVRISRGRCWRDAVRQVELEIFAKSAVEGRSQSMQVVNSHECPEPCPCCPQSRRPSDININNELRGSEQRI